MKKVFFFKKKNDDNFEILIEKLIFLAVIVHTYAMGMSCIGEMISPLPFLKNNLKLSL